jgi:hypothetical protein
MKDEARTTKQLIGELVELRKSVAWAKNAAEDLKRLQESNEMPRQAFLHSAIPMAVATIEEGEFVRKPYILEKNAKAVKKELERRVPDTIPSS